MSEKIITVEMDDEKRLFTPEGKPVPFEDLPPLTDEEAEKAAWSDPDNLPLKIGDAVKALPRTRTLRRVLNLTQQAFAARYHIPIGTLRDWEQGRCEPDATSRAYLKVIAGDPEGVRRVLEDSPSVT
jgi:putative transcriptional regulator